MHRNMNILPRYCASARQAAQASTSASTKQYKNVEKVRHKGVLKGLEEAQRLHKPEGWSRSLEDFTNQPYQRSGGSQASKSRSAEDKQMLREAEPREDPTAIPRRRGVTDGPWDGRDDEAMIEALKDTQGRSAGKVAAIQSMLTSTCVRLADDVQ